MKTLEEIERYQNFLRDATGCDDWMISEALPKDKEFFSYAIFVDEETMQEYLRGRSIDPSFTIWEFDRMQRDVTSQGKQLGEIKKHFFGFSYLEWMPVEGLPNYCELLEAKEKTATLLDTFKNLIRYIQQSMMKTALEQFQYAEFMAQGGDEGKQI